MEKIKALNEAELEQVSGGYRGRGGNSCSCPYCGMITNSYDLENHIYSVHTEKAYKSEYTAPSSY